MLTLYYATKSPPKRILRRLLCLLVVSQSRVKPNATAELNKTIEKDILPVLKKQKGFQDELTLVCPQRIQKSLVSACGIKDKMPKPINAQPIQRCKKLLSR